MKTVEFPCRCGATLQMDRTMVGRQARCGNCGTVLVVPDPTDLEIQIQASAEPHGKVQVMKWFEPSIMKRVDNKAFHRWISLGIILGMGIFGVIMRSLATPGPTPHSYSLVFWGCTGVGVLFDLVRRMYLYVPSIGIISQEGINKNTMFGIGAHLEFWPWHMIGSGRVEMTALGYKSIRLLALYSHDQQKIGVIGMPLSASVEQVAQAFGAMGKPISC